MQRDGAHVQAPVDRLIRKALGQAELPYSVVCGSGSQRFSGALAAVRHALDWSKVADKVGTGTLAMGV